MSGTVIPLPLNPAPETVIWERVTFTLPVLLIEIAFVLLVPVVTLPKLTVVGVAVSWAKGAAAPVPFSDTVGFVVALLTKETCPEAAPTAVGAKVTV